MGAIGFDDHHRYLNADCRQIVRRATERHADALITTFKDYVKIAGYRQWPLPLAVVDVRITFGQAAEQFASFVRRSLASDVRIAG